MQNMKEFPHLNIPGHFPYRYFITNPFEDGLKLVKVTMHWWRNLGREGITSVTLTCSSWMRSMERDIVLLSGGEISCIFLYWVKTIYNAWKNKRNREWKSCKRGRINPNRTIGKIDCTSPVSERICLPVYQGITDRQDRLARMDLLLVCHWYTLSFRSKWNKSPLQVAHSWRRHLGRAEAGSAGNPSLIVKPGSRNFEEMMTSEPAKCLPRERSKNFHTGDWEKVSVWAEQVASTWPYGLTLVPLPLYHSLLSSSLKVHLCINIGVELTRLCPPPVLSGTRDTIRNDRNNWNKFCSLYLGSPIFDTHPERYEDRSVEIVCEELWRLTLITGNHCCLQKMKNSTPPPLFKIF